MATIYVASCYTDPAPNGQYICNYMAIIITWLTVQFFSRNGTLQSLIAHNCRQPSEKEEKCKLVKSSSPPPPLSTSFSIVKTTFSTPPTHLNKRATLRRFVIRRAEWSRSFIIVQFSYRNVIHISRYIDLIRSKSLFATRHYIPAA